MDEMEASPAPTDWSLVTPNHKSLWRIMCISLSYLMRRCYLGKQQIGNTHRASVRQRPLVALGSVQLGAVQYRMRGRRGSKSAAIQYAVA